MSETRTSPLLRRFVDALQQDMEEGIRHLEEGHAVLQALVDDTRGVNGLSVFLKAQCNQLEKMIADAREEAESVPRKMYGTAPRPQIVERVNLEKVEELRQIAS